MKALCELVDQEMVAEIKDKAATGALYYFVDGRYESYGKIDLLAYKESKASYIPGTSVLGNKPGTAEGPPELIPNVEHITKPVGTTQARVPRGYILPEEMKALIPKLEGHNIKYEILTVPMIVSGEAYHIDSVRHINWMGFSLTRLDGQFKATSSKTFPAGSIHVDLAQPMARLAFYCLEPQTRDGFLGWGILDSYLLKSLENEIIYPIFKYYKKH